LYVAALVRSILALHNLINNKVQNRDAERNEGKEATKKIGAGDATGKNDKDKKKDEGKDKKKEEGGEKDKSGKTTKDGAKTDSAKEKDTKDTASKTGKKK